MKKRAVIIAFLASFILMSLFVIAEENLSPVNLTNQINETNQTNGSLSFEQNISQNLSQNNVLPPVVKKCTPNCQPDECATSDGCGGECWGCQPGVYCEFEIHKCRNPSNFPWFWIIIAVLVCLGGFLFYYFSKQAKNKQQNNFQQQWNQPFARPPYHPGVLMPRPAPVNLPRLLYPPRS